MDKMILKKNGHDGERFPNDYYLLHNLPWMYKLYSVRPFFYSLTVKNLFNRPVALEIIKKKYIYIPVPINLYCTNSA